MKEGLTQISEGKGMEEVIINSIQEYIKFIEQYKGDYYFRGQADADWVVEPNIFRDLNKLKNECTDINEQYSNNCLVIIKKILKIQHYGNGTRLCDITINPMVALYFAIEDESKDDKPCAIFIFNKSINISLDSIEMKVLLLLTIKELSSLDELQNEVALKLGIRCDKSHLERIISNNYIINYDINLSYSNQRALLQGGTGIYFGFDVKGDCILRKGDLEMKSLCTKITIPSSKKVEIRRYLRQYGISKAVLYDNVSGSDRKLGHTITEKSIARKSDFNKVILDVIVSDIVYVETDIYEIISAVFQKSKKQYGSNARIFMYVYYDKEDTRCGNWIARPTPINDFTGFELNFNNEYHAKRMTYFNQEISINTIYSATEPIVEKCEQGLKAITEVHDNYFTGNLTRDEYRNILANIKKSLFNPVYYDLQDISHGSGIYDEYYQSSKSFCEDVIGIADDQLIYIDSNSNDASIEYNYNMKKEKCDKSFKKYIKAYQSLKLLSNCSQDYVG